MKALVMAAMSLALVACDPRAGDQDTQVPSSAPPPASSAPSEIAGPQGDSEVAISLSGEYRVAGVDGADIDQPYAITASISADRVHVTADCLNFAWNYTVRDGAIATTRVPVEGCARGLTPAEEAVVAALDAVITAVRTPANAIELRGGGHSLTLFSQ